MINFLNYYKNFIHSSDNFQDDIEIDLERKLKIIYKSTLLFLPLIIIQNLIKLIFFTNNPLYSSVSFYMLLLEVFVAFELVLISINNNFVNLSGKLTIYVPILSIWLMEPLGLINYYQPEISILSPPVVIIIMLSVGSIFSDIKDITLATIIGISNLVLISVLHNFQSIIWFINSIILIVLFYFIFLIVLHYKILTKKQLSKLANSIEFKKDLSLESIKANKKLYNSISHEFLTPLHSINGNLLEIEKKIGKQSEQAVIIKDLISRLDSIKLWTYYLLDYDEMNNFFVFNSDRIMFYDLITDFQAILLNNPVLQNNNLLFFMDSFNQSIIVDKIRFYLIIIDFIFNVSTKTPNKDTNIITINLFLQSATNSNYLYLIFNVENFNKNLDKNNQISYMNNNLTLNKKFIFQMNGQFCFEFSSNEFLYTVKIPIKIDDHSKMQDELMIKEYSEKNNSKILVADDFEDNRFLIKTYLKNLNAEIDEAENGSQTLELLKTNSYDLVLMDIKMPGMDGISITRNFREWERKLSLKRTPIIFITAYLTDIGNQEDLEYLVDNNVINKPFKKEDLMNYISNIGILK